MVDRRRRRRASPAPGSPSRAGDREQGDECELAHQKRGLLVVDCRVVRGRSSRKVHPAATSIAATDGGPSARGRRSAPRAVVRLVLGEEDRLDRRPAAGAGLALAPVDLQRHRQLVGDSRRSLPRNGDRVSRTPSASCSRATSSRSQLRALAEGREPRLPEDLVDPGAPDAGDVALVAQQGMQVAGLVDQLAGTRPAGEVARPRARGSPPSRPSATSSAAEASPRLAAGCRTRAASAPGRRRAGPAPARPGPWARRACERCSRPADIRWISTPDRRARPPASSRSGAPRSPSRPSSSSSGGSNVFITFIPGARADSTKLPGKRGQPARGDLDFRQLWHREGGRDKARSDYRLEPSSFDWFRRRRASEHQPATHQDPLRISRMKELPTINAPVRVLNLSPGGDRASSARKSGPWRPARRRHPRPQLPAARGPGRRRLRR